MAYTPQYLDSLDDVPVQVPDDYSQADKANAVELAETLIELDVNDGQALTTVATVHKAAIKQRATCELVKGSEDNDDVALGDLQDDGITKSDYAHESFCRHYENLVAKIRDVTESDSYGSFVYNTGKSENREEYERALENIDVDKEDDFARRDSW